MKKRVRKHPLKDIVLHFNEGIAAPDFEVVGLQEYVKAHDLTWAVKRRFQDMLQKLTVINQTIDSLQLDRLAMEQDMDFVEEALGLTTLDADILPEGELTIDVTQLFQRVWQQNQHMIALYPKVEAAVDEYNEFMNNLYDDDYLIDPHYFKVLDKLYQRYEELSVDLVSLDHDRKEFLEAYGEVDETFDQYYLLGQEVFEKYSYLYELLEELYKRNDIVQAAINNKFGTDDKED